LFSHSIQILPLLNNPLNIELLTRHILQSPAIWSQVSVQRYTRILAGFRACLGWKVTDLQEGKGGIAVDDWILAVGRGAIGDGNPMQDLLTSAEPWRHVLLFAGLRSAISEESSVKRKTTTALENAYVRAFSGAIGDVNRDVAEGMSKSEVDMSDIVFVGVDGTS
jgi:hypothetical protein